MAAFGHSIPAGNMHRLTVVLKHENPVELFQTPADDGLGCIRGIVAVVVVNAAFALVAVGAWELWRLLH